MVIVSIIMPITALSRLFLATSSSTSARKASPTGTSSVATYFSSERSPSLPSTLPYADALSTTQCAAQPTATWVASLHVLSMVYTGRPSPNGSSRQMNSR